MKLNNIFHKELSYLDNTQTLSKSAFAVLIFFDKKYKKSSSDDDKFADMLFQAFDCDASGQLTFEEFLNGKRLFESKDIRDNIRFIFRLLDYSKDKRIEKQEIELFITTLHKAGAPKSDDLDEAEYAHRMVEDLDKDKNGMLDEEEFVEGIMRNQCYVDFIKSIRPQD